MSEVFWAKVARGAPNECWPWLGFKKPSGHGLTSLNSIPIHASRKAWVLTHGDPGELCVLHRCDNAACCNPSHMYLGTRADNMFDHFGKALPLERAQRGRPIMFNDEQLEALYRMRTEQGLTLKQCAERTGIHLQTVRRYVTAYRRKIIERIRADRLARKSA